MAHVVAQSPALGEPYLLDIQDGIFDYAQMTKLCALRLRSLRSG